MLLKELAPGGLRPLPATNLILPEGPVDPKDPVWKDSFSVYEHRQIPRILYGKIHLAFMNIVSPQKKRKATNHLLKN